jgi:hypothetical protein
MSPTAFAYGFFFALSVVAAGLTIGFSTMAFFLG